MDDQIDYRKPGQFMQSRTPSVWTDRIWGLFGSLLVLLLGGVAYAVWQDHTLNQANSYKIESISNDITEIRQDLREKGALFYTRKEAESANVRFRGLLDDHEARIRMLERSRPLIAGE